MRERLQVKETETKARTTIKTTSELLNKSLKIDLLLLGRTASLILTFMASSLRSPCSSCTLPPASPSMGVRFASRSSLLTDPGPA